MYHSLSRLMSLPGDTQIYCAHEYTEANLKFALSVEPGNNNIVQRAEAVAELRSQGIPSVPSNIKVEKATNPLLRTSSAEIISNIKAKMQSAGTLSQTEVFTQLRKMKDVF